MFNNINIVILLLLVICNEECLCDICKMCVCSTTDKGSIADCHEKHLNTNKIHNFDFFTLGHYQTLILSKNNITSLPIYILKNVKHLKKLDLSQNHLNKIHANIFNDLNNLEDLDYSNNLLWSFDISILSIVPSLTKLSLSHNEIISLQRSSKNIQQDTKLKILDLSHNNLTDFCWNFLNSLIQLEYLDLSFNKLTSLQVDPPMQLQHLRNLYISNNYFHSLNLQSLPSSLIELHAGNNFISNLSFKKSFIRILNIENNQISNLWQNLTLLEEIRYLNLSRNFLSNFPDIILKKMELLDLSFNNLSIISESISVKNFPMLKIFNISGNHLKDMRIRSELRLKVLKASFVDSIEEINEEMFLKLKQKNECINITISNCAKLSIIRENVFQHMNVCSLDLSDNRFVHLSKLIHNNNNENIRRLINLQGNPFICNCSLQWMLDEFVPFLYITRPSLLQNLKCAGPPPLTNKRLVHWYQWKDKVFCSNFSERITANIAGISNRQLVTFEMSSGMLIVIAVATTLLVILITIGIFLTRKMIAKRKRINRRF